MSAAQIDEVVAAIADAVAAAEIESESERKSGGLTVDELTEAIVERVGSWAGDRVMPAFQDNWPRWRQAESVATSRGALCFGPGRGRRATYTSPRLWLPGFRPAPAEEALAALVRSYLHAYGPATAEQFGRWLGAPRAWSAQLFARLGDALQPVSFEGVEAWQNAGEASAEAAGEASAEAEVPSVRLVPYFDAYVIGCQPRATLFPGRAGERALTGGQAGNVPVLLIDGLVAGVWHQRRSGRRIAVTVEPFVTLTARQRRSLGDEVERVGQVLAGTGDLTLGTVSVGAHA